MSYGFYIDSATSFAILALFEDDKVVRFKKIPVGPLSKEDLFVEIDAVLGDVQLDYISLSTGPGSYTGMRVASIIATTLAYSLEIPLVTFSSMDGFEYSEPFAVVLDAKRGNVYLKDGEEVSFNSIASLEKIDKIFLTPHESLLKEKGRWIVAEPCLQRLAKLSKSKFDHKDFADPLNVNLLYLQNPYTSP